MQVSSFPCPYPSRLVDEVPLIGRQILIARPVKPLANHPNALSVLGIGQR